MRGKLGISKRVRAYGRIALLSAAALISETPGSVAAAQQSAQPVARAGTSPHKPSPAVTDQNEYPFQKALEQLNGRQADAPAVPSVSQQRAVELRRVPPVQTGGTGPTQTTNASLAAQDAALHRPVVLGANAEKAIELSDAMKLQSAMPTQGKDGRVTYTFGSGLPTVVCSPLHISIVELEPGEVLTSEPTIGDSVRWEIMPGSSGSGKEAQPLIIIKPHVPNLDTNLVVTTNKRTYYLRLVSHETDYVARTAFSYRDDEEAQWKQYLEQQQQARVAQEDAQIVTPMAGAEIDKLNFDYDVKGGNAVIRPIRIMDDGQKTYITMPDAVLHQDLPALVVVNTRLKGEKAQEIVNYRVKGDMYIVDRLFDRAALVIGSGKAVDKVEIRRRVALARGK
jgi:type IV secretion system protein TrbG